MSVEYRIKMQESMWDCDWDCDSVVGKDKPGIAAREKPILTSVMNEIL